MSHFLNGSTEYFIFDCEGECKETVSVAIGSSVEGHYSKHWIFEDEVLVIYTPEETTERANSRIAENKYSLPFNNCEHY